MGLIRILPWVGVVALASAACRSETKRGADPEPSSQPVPGDAMATDTRSRDPAVGAEPRLALSPAAAAKDPRAIVDRAIARKGGAERLTALRTIRTRATANGRRMEITIEVPARQLVEYYTGDAVTERLLVDLERGIARRERAGQVRQTDDAETRLLLDGARAASTLLLRAAAGPVELRHAGDGTVTGRAADAVELKTSDGFVAVVFFDPDDAEVLALRYGDTTVLESDHRDVAGIRVAHRTEVTTGTLRYTATVEEVKLDEAIPAGTFDLPRR
jgi:hypothetical protein